MTEINNLITDNIDVWTSAIKKRNATGRGSSKKIELTGVKKLRELILELAVRGKLVPQDANDELASVLLEKIAEEKAQAIAEKVVKKQKPLPEITDKEIPFELPQGWTWTRLGDSGDTNVGLTYSPKDAGDIGTPVLRSTNIQKGKIDLNELVRVDMKVKESALVNEGDLLICARNGSKALVGKTASIPNLSEPMAFGAFMAIYRSPFNKYFEKFINSPVFRRNLTGTATTTINQITQGNLRATIAPVPPLAEQHRIVAKVDELMALCDELEQQTEQSLTAHQTLVEALLSTLTQSVNSQDFQESWQRIADHFDVLFTTEHSIEQLKQTILQLAVMGKLVPQNLDDEPASKLLEKIAEEKVQLIKDKKIKKQKLLPEITDEEKPFELPSGWEWCKFGEVVNFKAELVKPDNYQMFDQVAPDSIEKGTGRLLFRRTVKESGIKGSNSRFYEGQLLYSKIRPSLSKAIIAEFDGLCSADMYPLEPMVDSKYLLKTILSEVFLAQVRVAENRIKMPKLNIESLSNIIAPMPPLAEQHRIVAKVDELMALCEQLKTRLADAQITQLYLADAVVENAL